MLKAGLLSFNFHQHIKVYINSLASDCLLSKTFDGEPRRPPPLLVDTGGTSVPVRAQFPSVDMVTRF